jgi:MFS family permease
MADPTPPEGRPNPLAAGRRMLDGAYLRADGVLDYGQHRVFRLFWLFLPATSVARKPRFQQILASRFLSDAGQQALAYGALIAVVRGGGSAFEAALVGVAALVPPALLGLYGGAVADALPKRVALAAIYNLQALLCFIVPGVAGTDLAAILFLVFAVNTLGQVSGPTESAVLPHVASEEELASAASLVGLSANLGTAFGTALLAPVLARVFGTDVVFYVAGALLFLAASRVFDLTTHEAPHDRDWRRPNVNVRSTVGWLISERAVATMIVVAVLAGTANIVLQTLAPRYVSAALGVDPADAVYVFAPSAVGLAAALAATPALIRRFRERIVALAGFAVTAGTLCVLGFVPEIAGIVDAVNPMRLTGLFGIELSQKLRTAGLLAVFVGFGLSMTTTSVQTYINRRVPLHYQGRAFALQSTLKNGAAIVPLLALGAAASYFGVEMVLIFSPFVLLALAAALVRLSYALGGSAPATRLDVLASFWQESDAIVRTPETTSPSLPAERGPGGEAPAASSADPAQPESHDDREHDGA